MIGKRFIDGDKLLKLVEDRLGSASEVKTWLKRQPRSPQLVSRQGAAEILGKHTSHLRRMEDRLPPAIHIEGTRNPFYLRADILTLKKELAREEAEKRKPAAAAQS